MAMEPVLLVCDGCGVRIRTRHPAKARSRACPRCDSPLADVVDRALGLEPSSGRPGSVSFSALPPSTDRRRTGTALAAVLAVGLLACLAVREKSPGVRPSGAADRTALRPVFPRASSASRSTEATDPVPPIAWAPDAEFEDIPDLARPTNPPARDLAILDPSRRDPALAPAPPRAAVASLGPLDRSTPSPPRPVLSPDSKPTPDLPDRSGEPRRLLVRDPRGRAIVAREYGRLGDRTAAILPDGQIGWPEGLVVAEDPFVPASLDEMRRDLLDDPELAAFRLHQTAHYLVMYQCGEPFARASSELLEKLLDGLTGTLKKHGLPIAPMEFPLVAVIFATEDDFRANRRVAPDVQAYYETLSNRIYFYEKSRRDQDAPEVSALRRPQTVAHEGTHQILHNVGIQPRLSDWPLWLVEGLAEYCSSTRFTKKGVEWAGLGQANPIHLATIRDLDDPLPNQFRGDHREAVVLRDRGMPLVEYLVTRKKLTPTDYAFSWALTHYLANQRLDEFVEYIKNMRRLRPFDEQSPADQLAAFREAFGADLAQMDAKVGKYLKKFKPTDALPHYAVIFEQPVGPAAVRRHYMVSQSPSVIRQWIDSVTAPEGGPPHWQVFPHLSQKKALEAAEHWMADGR
jgi:hypothetical protein